MNADEYLERAEQKERERLAAIPDPGKKGAAFLLYAAKEALLTCRATAMQKLPICWTSLSQSQS